MLHILFLAGQILLLVVLVISITLAMMWSLGNLKNKVPFVTAANAVLKDIALALDIKDDSLVYDLGCGDGRMLFYLAQNNPKASYIGIENNRFAVILARFLATINYKKNGNKVTILNQDFFKVDLSKATHLYTYLYPQMMDELLPKFEKELKPGTKLVSLSFKFATKVPTAEIDLKRNKYQLGHKIYIYQF